MNKETIEKLRNFIPTVPIDLWPIPPSCIQDLLNIAEHSLSAQDEVPAQEPIYYSITYKGMHCNNVVRDREYAESELARLNKQYPDGDRAIVPLYTAPPALAGSQVQAAGDAVPIPGLPFADLATAIKEFDAKNADQG